MAMLCPTSEEGSGHSLLTVHLGSSARPNPETAPTTTKHSGRLTRPDLIRLTPIAALIYAPRTSVVRCIANDYTLVVREMVRLALLRFGPTGRTSVIKVGKEIRQKGNVQMSGAGFQAQIPYEIVVGVTFDQQQVDVP